MHAQPWHETSPLAAVPVSPGWYIDPGGAQGMRWWDGHQWSADFYPRPYEYRGPNHILHAILTIMLCGLWAIPWAIIAAVNKKYLHWLGPPPTWAPVHPAPAQSFSQGRLPPPYPSAPPT